MVVNVPFYATFVNGASMRTHDGGRLVFHSERERDPADGPPSVDANCVAALAPWPNRSHAEEPIVFALTTALVDSNGELWQRTRGISVCEIWAAVLIAPVLYQWESRFVGNAESRTHRVLIEPIETLCDMRESHLIEVIRERSNAAGPVAYRPNPYDDVERLLFRFRFKYFGAAIGLVEDRPSPPGNCVGHRICNGRLLVTIQPKTDTDMVTMLDQRDRILESPSIQLSQLGALCSCEVRLQPGWDQPAWELPQLGDLAAWQSEFRQIGADPSSLLAFKPNPSIRYEPCAQN